MINFFGTVFSPLTNLARLRLEFFHTLRVCPGEHRFYSRLSLDLLPLTLKQVKSMRCKT